MSRVDEQTSPLRAAGKRLANYRIDEVVGQGGMGIVYRAHDLRLKRRVALKLLSPALAEDEAFRERFVRESELAASVDHPNVIPVFEGGEENGTLFIAMRYVEGLNLREYLQLKGRLDARETRSIADQVAGALDAAHRARLVHRDVKPANVLLEPRDLDGGHHCYLTDFGLTVGAWSHSGLTGSGHFMGTVNYVAPEQIRGAPVGPEADVYGLGCVLFECLTGTPPFGGRPDGEIVAAHLREAPPEVSRLCPDLPAEVDQVLARALAKLPNERQGDCTALALDLRHSLRGASSHRGSTDGQLFPAAVPPRPSPARTRARTRPSNGAPPPAARVPTMPAPDLPPSGRNALTAAIIVAVAILLCAGGIAAALLLSRDSGGNDTAAGRRINDRTRRLNDRLGQEAVQPQRGTAAAPSTTQLEQQARQARELQRQTQREITHDARLRASLLRATNGLLTTTRLLRNGSRRSLRAARVSVRKTTKVVIYVTNLIQSKPSGGSSKSGGKTTQPAAVTLPGHATRAIEPPSGTNIVSLRPAGDVNKDGTQDQLVVVSPPGSNAVTKDAYVVFGDTQGGTVQLDNLGSSGYRITGATDVSPAGDLNGDGFADIAAWLRVSGDGTTTVYLLPGSRNTNGVDLAAQLPNHIVDYSLPKNNTDPGCAASTSSVAIAAGDVNNSGKSDLVIADPCYNGGTAWVIFDPVDGPSLPLDQIRTHGFEIDGLSSGVNPVSVAPAGDFNGDGKADVLIGSPSASGGGAAYVVLGDASTNAVSLNSVNRRVVTIGDRRSNGDVGAALTGLGDVNGDGKSDVLVGAPGTSTSGGSGSGAAYVLFGGKGSHAIDVSTLDRGFAIYGPAAGNGQKGAGLGQSVGSPGDLNGDGRPDALIAAPGLDGGGAAYIVYGKDNSNAVDLRSPGSAATEIDAHRNGGVLVSGLLDPSPDAIPQAFVAPDPFGGAAAYEVAVK